MRKILSFVILCVLVRALSLAAFMPIAKADTSGATSSPSPQPAPAPCHAISAQGYLYDNYEKAEYINGYLALHLKLKAPYNDGRVGGNGLDLYAADCTFEVFPNPTPGIAFRPGMQYFSIRFDSPTHYDYWDDEQDIKMDCQACSVTIPPVSPSGKIYTTVGFEAFIDGYASFLNSGSYSITGISQNRNPLIIIPGILGSVFSSPDQVLWPNLDKMVSDPGDSFMDPLQMDSAGRPTDGTIHDTGVLSSINYVFGQFHYSDQLENYLQQNGYTLGQNLFLFHYDWRQDASSIADTLKNEIAEVLQQTGSSQVDFIAHSYGGLVLKQYLLSAQDSQIGKIIFVAVPNLGSAAAAKALIFGDNLNIPLLSSDEIFKLAQNMPSIYDLLPTQEYFKHIPGFYDDLSTAKVKNILGYADTKAMFLNLNKNNALINAAEALHINSLDSMDLSQKPYSVYNIVGCGTFTVETINKMYAGEPNLLERAIVGPKYRIMADSGDGTVLLQSAEHLGLPQGHLYFAYKAKHAEMLSNPDIINLIGSLLLGAGAAQYDSTKIGTDVSGCSLSGKLISFSSGLEFTVQTSSGKVLNPGDYISTTVGHDTHVFIPDDHAYKVIIKPEQPKQAENISLTRISQNQNMQVNTQIVNYKNVVVNQDLLVDLPAAAGSGGTDNGGVGSGLTGNSGDTVENQDSTGAEQDVAPSEVLDDNFQPVQSAVSTQIYSAAGAAADNDNILMLDPGNAYIYFKAQSSAADILDTQYSLDSGQTWNVVGSGEQMIAIPLNVSQVDFYSEDKAGNIEDQKNVVIKWQAPAPPPQQASQPSLPQAIIVQPQTPLLQGAGALSPQSQQDSSFSQAASQDYGDQVYSGHDSTSQDTQNDTANQENNSGDVHADSNVDPYVDSLSGTPPNLNINLQLPRQPQNSEPRIIYIMPRETDKSNTMHAQPQVNVRERPANYWGFIKKIYDFLRFSTDLMFF